MIAGDSRFQYDDHSSLSSRSRLPWFTHLYIFFKIIYLSVNTLKGAHLLSSNPSIENKFF